MKLWLSIWAFLTMFHAFGQSDYARAVRLFEEADSIRYVEDNQLEKDKDNYRLAIGKFEEARDLFNAVDSTYTELRCTAGLLKCKIEMDDLVIEEIQDFQNQLNVLGIYDSLMGEVFYHKGVLFKQKNQIDLAIELFHRADSLFDEKQSYLMSIKTRWFLGLTYGLKKEYDLQQKYYERALIQLSQIPFNIFRVRSEFALGRSSLKSLMMQGRISEFWRIFFDCKSLFENYRDIISDKEIAWLYLNAGRAFRIAGYYEKSHEMSKEARSHFDLQWPIGLNEALTYAAEGKYSHSNTIYKELLSLELSDRRRSIALNNLGSNQYSVGGFDIAKALFLESLALNNSLNRKDGMSVNLGNLAEVCIEQDQLGEAEYYLNKVSKAFINRSLYLNDVRSKFFEKAGNLDSALIYAKKSIFNQSEEIVLDQTVPSQTEELLDNIRRYILLNDRKIRLWNKGNNDEILDSYDRFHYHLRNQSLMYDHSTNFSEFTDFIYSQSIRHSLMMSNSDNISSYLTNAFKYSEWSKVHSLQRAKKTAQAKFLAGLPNSVIGIERSLKVDENYFRSQLSQQENLEAPDSSRITRYRTRLSEIEESQDSLENEIRINYPRYHQLRYQDITLTVEEVQERLKPSQAFVEYYEGDTTSFVFTITKDDYQVERIHLDDDTLITRFREHFDPENFNPEQQQIDNLSHLIYQSYLQPAIQDLDPTIDELIVVPDGKLSYVPFDILLTEPVAEQDSREIPYLLRKYQVHYTYSASLYFNDFSTLSTKNEYLAFAPEYEAALSDTASINLLGNFRSQVTPLKHNQEEVSYISRNFKGLGYFGANANERNFKENVDEYGLLHLAMHTIVDDEDPMNSKLVFTNSKDSLEDDMLHAFEIYNMEIPSQLAVLSACETGFGKLAKGEGALSLARAFSYAGSPSVVMSHWPVDDQTTTTLMKSFYDYLAAGYTKSDALRRAKLDFLEQTHSARIHPYFWGSFVVMGDDSPVYIKRLPLINPLWVALLCLIVVGSTGYVVVRNEL